MKTSQDFLSTNHGDKVGPFRLLRFSNASTENEVVLISRRERTVRLSLPRVKTANTNTERTTDWAERSLKNFERNHNLTNKTTHDEFVNTFKASLKEQFSFVSPAIDRNLQRLSLTRSKLDESRPMTPFIPELIPPKQNLVEHDAILIDRHYPNPSYSRAGNKIVLPGDYEFDIKRYEQLAKSQYSLMLFKSASEKSQPVNPIDELEEPNDEEFIMNLMKKQHEAKSLPKQKENLLSGLNMFWSQREVSSTRPEAREGATLVCINRRFYLFAGQGKDKRNDVRVLNPDTWLWTQMNTAYTPKGRIGHTACPYKNKMVVFGGWAHYSQRMGIRRCFRKVYILRLKQGSWYSRIGSGDPPRPRRCHMASVLGRSLIIFGGLDEMSKRLRSTYVYDLKEQNWVKLPKLQIPGGRSNGTLSAVFHSSLLSRSDFSVMAPPKLKAEFVLPGGGFYLFGGLNDEDQPSNELHVLEIREGTLAWSEVTYSGTPPLPRYDHVAAFIQGNLIISGGRNDSLYARKGDSCLNDVHILKIETMSWESVIIHGAVPEGRWGHCAAVYGSKMLMLGGINHHSYLPSEIHVLETDQSYVTELVRQQGEQERKRESEMTALKRTTALFATKLRGK
mmetsp:Transcript_7608/g.14298  ORF Transcript_7608/g.14298 Transcript_7608/m.14298 type:complete len:620 (+) Transcript_7608:6168-8027(+)